MLDQSVKLYVVAGLRENVHLEPRSKAEIRSVQWFKISDLPENLKDKDCKERTGYSSGSFFIMIPFIQKIKDWIKDEKKRSISKVIEEQESPSIGFSKKCSTANSFIPDSWRNFSFCQEEIEMASLGFPVEFMGNMRLR